MIELVFGGSEGGREGGRSISHCLVLAYNSSKCPLDMGLTSICSTFSLGIENPFIYQSSFAIVMLERASPTMLSMWSKLSYVLFCKPTHKTETRTLYRRTTRDSKPPERIIMMDQSEKRSRKATSLSAGAQLYCAFYQRRPKPFSWAKPAYFRFSSSNFTAQDHIPSTAGDAVPATKTKTTLTLFR